MSEEDVIPETGAVFTYGKSSFADNIPSHFFIRNDPVVEISCGEEHSGIVCKNGRVFCFGKNSFGQLGLGHTENVYKPNCVKNLKPDKVKHIACGRSHTIVSTENNTVYGFGDNSDSQLGHPVSDVINSDVPVEVTRFNDKIVQIAAGSYHTAVLLAESIPIYPAEADTDRAPYGVLLKWTRQKSASAESKSSDETPVDVVPTKTEHSEKNGDVYVWGSNSDRQLGLDSIDEDSVSVRVPTIVPIVQPVVHVSCGHGHTAFVTKAGDLFTCGDREYGKLGHDQWSLGRVDTAEKIVQVACGANHTIALNDVGKVFVCGNNDCGQIGLRNVTSQGHLYPCPVTDERIVRITCGESHSAFITANGKLYTCGDGKYGKLCADVNQITIPTLVSTFVDRHLNVQMASCGGNHTLVHAEPADDGLAVDGGGQQTKSADSLPPLKVAKKATDSRKETAEPFTSIIASATNGNDQATAVLIVAVEENAKETNKASTIDQQINVDKNSYYNTSSSSSSTAETTYASTNDKSLEKDGKKSSNMLVNSSNNDQKKEKKAVNKSKYPRNERVRSRMCVII